MPSLFLDRDGVINVKRENDYVKSWDEFEFRSNFLDHVAQLAHWFAPIVVITNQRGIGRGLMAEADLSAIHQHMMTHIHNRSGRIDAIYFCPNIEDAHPNRKPRVGMALQAKFDFPDLRFQDSVLIGDSACDMRLGRQLNMTTLYLNTTVPSEQLRVDAHCTNWDEIMAYLKTYL